MPREATTDAERSDRAAFLSDVTYDLMPSEGFEDALSPLPEDARVAVVLTPDRGIEPTVERTELAAERGYEVVPHVAARFIEDRDELDAVAGRLADAGAILEWIEGVRERGIDLPVEPGIPGVVDYRRLMALSRRWEIADPLRFIQKTTGVLGFTRAMIGSDGRFDPGEMVETLAPYYGDPEYDLHRLRLYTFNQTEDTESWRRERLR